MGLTLTKVSCFQPPFLFYKWKTNNIYLKELSGRLNEVINMKYSAECLKRKMGQ